MAYWYGQFLKRQLKDTDSLSEHALCVYATMGQILEADDYRSIKRAAFNVQLAETVKEHVKAEIHPKDHWLKMARKYVSEGGEDSDSKEEGLPTIQLRSARIQNFRSFGESQSLQMHDNNGATLNRIIVFGPNGSGKSSVCQAIERELTGFIRECDRREMTLASYCRRHGSSNKPEVQVSFSTEAELDENQKRFAKSCFIEKNRIEDFALLKKSKESMDIIAVVIGLEDLKKIVDDIIIAPSSCRIGTTDYMFTSATKALDTWKNTSRDIDTNIAAAKQNEVRAVKELANILTIDDRQCDTEFSRRTSLEEEVDKLGMKHSNLSALSLCTTSKDDLADAADALSAAIDTYVENVRKIEAHGSNVDFKQLYEAVKSLGTKAKEACPACDTPMDKVKRNPFTKAQEELPKLKALEDLQEQKAKNLKDIEKQFVALLKIIEGTGSDEHSSICWTCFELDAIPLIIRWVRDQSHTHIAAYGETQLSEDELTLNARNLLGFLGSTANKIANEIDARQEIENAVDKEKDRVQKSLQTSREDLTTLSSAYKNYKHWLKEMARLNAQHQAHVQKKKELEEAVRIESSKNDFMTACNEAYEHIHTDFVKYKHELERQRTQNIQDMIASFYQQINATDSKAEEVKSVSIQVPDEQRNAYSIKLLFNDDTEKDAMHVLSEGHLRALGLSIMLAIAKKYELPFLIFDDAVNAIDSDHRANIIEMMFTDDYLKKTQLIVTTHDRLFWERFCLELGKGTKDDTIAPHSSYIVTYSDSGQGSVITQYNVNFESKIQSALDSFDLRQAMVYLRIWLETETLIYIARSTDGRLPGRLYKSKVRRFRGNALEPDIESMYQKVNIAINKSDDVAKEAWKFLRSELIEEVINQDSHTYSEALLNASHAKTSNEVKKIFSNAKIVIAALRTYTSKRIEEMEKQKKTEEELAKEVRKEPYKTLEGVNLSIDGGPGGS